MAPLQANEVNILRRKCQQFEVVPPWRRADALGEAGLSPGRVTRALLPQLKQHEFREKFQREAPFSFTDPDPYKSLNKVGRPRTPRTPAPSQPLLKLVPLATRGLGSGLCVRTGVHAHPGVPSPVASPLWGAARSVAPDRGHSCENIPPARPSSQLLSPAVRRSSSAPSHPAAPCHPAGHSALVPAVFPPWPLCAARGRASPRSQC